MSQQKSERIVNLTILLLSSRRYLSKDRIRVLIEGYHDMTDAGFERTFERDKDDLRRLGIPVQTGSNDAFFEDEVGYRIERTEFELPPVEFNPAEAAVLAVASHVWQEEAAGESTTLALAKLRAAGLPIEHPHTALQPALRAREASFSPLFEAVSRRTVVRFGYRGHPELRTVQPWSMPYRNGSWYVIGWDTGREALRCFKLSRISQQPELVGRDNAYQVPDNHDPQDALDAMAPQQAVDHAVLAVQDGHAPDLTRRGRIVESPVPLPDGFAAHEVPYGWPDELVGQACAHAPHVVLLSPPDLRAKAIARLRQVAAGVAGVPQPEEA